MFTNPFLIIHNARSYQYNKMNSLFYSVSRIENDYAVLELPDHSFKKYPLSKLPKGVKEGNILKYTSDKIFIIDVNEEERRKRRLLDLQNDIFK